MRFSGFSLKILPVRCSDGPFFGFMAGLAHDGKGIEVMLGCTCCKAAPQTVAGKISLVQANFLYVFFDDERYGFI